MIWALSTLPVGRWCDPLTKLVSQQLYVPAAQFECTDWWKALSLILKRLTAKKQYIKYCKKTTTEKQKAITLTVTLFKKTCWKANGALAEFFSGLLSGQTNAFNSQQQKHIFQIQLQISRLFFFLVKALKS